jgi:TrmH family RNA methyltransferase
MAGSGARARRRRISGAAAVAAALERGEDVRLVVVPAERVDPEAAAVCEEARARGVAVLRVSERQFVRLAPPDEGCGVLGLAGAAPNAREDEVLAAGGAAWLLTGTAYPGNAGFAIRTAEASGADGIFIDADFDHAGRREAVRVSMRADRFLPVFWRDAGSVLEAARAAGRRLVAIEDTGDRAPWEEDLTGAVLFVVGHEKEGVPGAALARCDRVIRIPMTGFLRAYNLHAAVAAVAAERLRQEGGDP